MYKTNLYLVKNILFKILIKIIFEEFINYSFNDSLVEHLKFH